MIVCSIWRTPIYFMSYHYVINCLLFIFLGVWICERKLIQQQYFVYLCVVKYNIALAIIIANGKKDQRMGEKNNKYILSDRWLDLIFTQLLAHVIHVHEWSCQQQALQCQYHCRCCYYCRAKQRKFPSQLQLSPKEMKCVFVGITLLIWNSIDMKCGTDYSSQSRTSILFLPVYVMFLIRISIIKRSIIYDYYCNHITLSSFYIYGFMLLM